MSGRFLLDTHALLWVLADDDRLSGKVRRIVRDAKSEVAASVVSLWEVILKHQAGRLELQPEVHELIEFVLERSGWTVLPVFGSHLAALCGLPRLHKDPFDRLLVAQAMAERLTILTADRRIPEYPVTTLW